MKYLYFLPLIICLSSVSLAQEDIPQEYNYYFIGLDFSIITKGDFMFGVEGGSLKAQDIGFFAGIKMSFQVPDEKLVYDNIGYLEATRTYKDIQRGEKYRYMDISLGISKNLLWNNLYLLLGMSYQIEEIFKEFYDNLHILGDDGQYYIKPELLGGMAANISFVLRTKSNSSITLGGTFGRFNLVSVGYNWTF